MRGCFGLNLETVALWMNGGTSDETVLRPSADLAWAGAQLETLDLDHFLPWEMECFSLIPSKLLVATRMEAVDFIKLIRDGAFPGLQTLVAPDRWQSSVQDERDYRNLEEACKTRGVELQCTNLSHPPTERVCRCRFLESRLPPERKLLMLS